MDEKKRILELIAKGAEPPIINFNTLTIDTSLIDELGYDSLGFIELVVSLEENFGVVIDDYNLNISDLSTPRKIIQLLGINT
jgi:acyl carrier protein